MQSDIESFVKQFGQANCYALLITAPQLLPREYQRRLNSAWTNSLREIFPHRIGVLEPHRSSYAHAHFLVYLPFQSPNFNHDALKQSRNLHKQKRFAESKEQFKIMVASMSDEHRELFYWLQNELPKYKLGSFVGLAPVRESGRAIACYFGKYLTKGLDQRPRFPRKPDGEKDERDWTSIHLVRRSGVNGGQFATWRTGTPLRSGNSKWHQNGRDKMAALAAAIGLQGDFTFANVLGPHWHYTARPLLESIQLDVYRSILHADLDGVPCTFPEPRLPRFVPHPQSSGELVLDESEEWMQVELFWPVERRHDARSADEVAAVLLEVAARTRPEAVSWRNGLQQRLAQERVVPHGTFTEEAI